MYHARFISGLIILLFVATTTAVAQEWTQWRGPGRDGFASPVILGTNILVRDTTSLMLLTFGT